jgi:hypothetical protein
MVPQATLCQGRPHDRQWDRPAAEQSGSRRGLYLNTTNWLLHRPKATGAWPVGVSLIGAAGEDGTHGTNGLESPTILNGVGAPQGNLGDDGDFYIDQSAKTAIACLLVECRQRPRSSSQMERLRSADVQVGDAHALSAVNTFQTYRARHRHQHCSGTGDHCLRGNAHHIYAGPTHLVPLLWQPSSLPWHGPSPATSRRAQMLDPSGGVSAGGSGAPLSAVVAGHDRPRV